MAEIRTETTMNMEHFHDFYFLEALNAAVTTELASRPELEFIKAVEKFQDDLCRTIDNLAPNMALRVFMYLYAACLGEARHSKDTVAERRFIRGTQSRGSWFAHAMEYPPTKENLDALLSVYDQEWRAGYGGAAWRNIAQALVDYDKTPASAWIDHVVDLEHNNGTAFSKPDGLDTIMFDVSYPDRFSNFLDYKFQKDILNKAPGFTLTLRISPRVYNLITRYSTIFGKKMPTHVIPELTNLGPYAVEWGDAKLEVDEKWCSWAAVVKENKPDVLWALNEVGMYEIYAGRYVKEEWLAKVAEKKAQAITLMGKWVTPSILKKLTTTVNNYIKENQDKCKYPRAKMTYGILPCTVKHTKKLNPYDPDTILHFPLPYQDGYGTQEEGGFWIAVRLGVTANYENAYVTKHYGETAIFADNKCLWVGNTMLEALLD